MTLHNLFPVRSSLFRISQMRQSLPSFVPGHLVTGSPAGNSTGNNIMPLGEQVSPDRKMGVKSLVLKINSRLKL
jgi:hypothetical protein